VGCWHGQRTWHQPPELFSLPQLVLHIKPLIQSETESVSVPKRRPSEVSAVPRMQPVATRTGAGPWPLSFAQQRVWFLDQLAAGSPVYNVPIAIRMIGRLHLGALNKALSALVERHETLRTRFVSVDGTPLQIISRVGKLELPLQDLSALPAEERERQLEERVAVCARRCFDLASDLLLDPSLIRCSEQDHTLVLNLHHICADGPSMGILHQELAAMYQAFAQGQEPSLPPLPVQYADYAQWQRNLYSPQALAKQLSYWRKQLEGAPPRLDMPSDFVRPAEQTTEGARHFFQLPEALADQLRTFSAGSGVSLFMTLLAGFEVLLHRYTGQEDIVVGTPVANRPRPELEGLIGFFLNTLALRIDVSGDPSFDELLKRVRRVALDGFGNADLPFEQLLEEIRPERDLSRSPIFQVMFTLQSVPTASFQLRDLKLTSRELDTGTSKFDLFVVMQERAHKLGGYVEYNTKLFNAATIERMISHLERLLDAAVVNPGEKVSRLPILGEAERHQLVVGWNDTRAQYPSGRCVHTLFEEQAERSPERVALRCRGQELRYAELNRRANQLAAKLIELGVGPEIPVGVCLHRSLEMVVAVLGVLKAGGAYVPMDSAYPRDWLRFLLEDSHAPVLLTQEKLLSDLPAFPGAVVCLDRDRDEIARYARTNPENKCSSDTLAYIIYTSGSTGTPKGVMGLHRGAVNRFAWMWEKYPFAADEVGCQKTSLNFVDSIWEIFGPLLRGVRSVVLSDEVLKDPLELAHELERERVSRIVLVPSLMRVLLDAYASLPLSMRRPKLWISSGEALTSDLCRRFHEWVPGGTLLNLYGSSEVAADVTFYECAAAAPPARVPLGRPIGNTQVHVLDSRLQVLPVGVPGEIYVGGDGLARGYHRRPELTAERFLPSPVPEFPGRLYKTGDEGLRRADGQIEYLGRSDEQVKIRGFRIELGQVQACLAKHPAVQNVVVSSHPEGAAGGTLLMAYAVPAQGTELREEGLRAFLRKRLPEQMVPARIVILNSLPLMPNGKVNRRALPPPQASPPVQMESPRAGSEIEARLVEIWQEILGRQPIGVNDNFFDLGGHSLMVSRLILRINHTFGRRLSLGDLFHAPTVAQLARLFNDVSSPSRLPGIVPIQPAGDRLPLFWISGGPRLRGLAQRLHSNQPFLGVHLPPPILQTLARPYKFEDLAGAFVGVLRQAQPQGPYHLCGLCVNGALAYEIARQIEQQGERVGLLGLFDSQNPALYFVYGEGRLRYFSEKAKYHVAKLVKAGNTSFRTYARDRWEGIERRVNFMRWRFLGITEQAPRLETPEDFDPIVHPASWTYCPQPYGGRVVLFQSMNWPRGEYWDYEAGWRGLARGGVEVHRLPGNQLAMFEEPNLTSVATQLSGYLAESTCVTVEPSDGKTLTALVATRMEGEKPEPGQGTTLPKLNLHQIVEEQVRRMPDALAVEFEGKKLTYEQLDRRANQLARYLRKLGVGLETRVAICLKRSLELPVVLLGVLKAGATCVPLDPSYPAHRLALMLEDSAAPVLLTEDSLPAEVPADHLRVVNLKREWDRIGQEDSSALPSEAGRDHVAYLIYTSGSTGTPKGVLVLHGGLVNHGTAVVELFGLQSSDRMLQFSSISFDIAIEEIFPAWAAGAVVVFRPEELSLQGSDFLEWVRERGITVLDLPTAYWHELVHAVAYKPELLPPSLRLVIVGGEKVSTTAYAGWKAVTGSRIRWINTYGPTEASVIATAYEPAADAPVPATLPIGKPIANTRIYLLDEKLQPVAEGAVGELHIGGMGLARGYLNRPETTREKFISDPFSADPAARLYKTGDMARWLPSGDIEFVGRRDFQVKIRGFRVEPGEVETVLATHAGVRDVLVKAWEPSEGDKRLAAYFVPIEGHLPSSSELRAFLDGKLPSYMVPSVFVKVDAMPLTPNGKVDRNALPVPASVEADPIADSAQPQDVLERQLTTVWERVLGIRPIGREQSFFDLGGHSLLAVRLMHGIEQELGRKLPITALLQAPTIAGLAALLRQQGWKPSWSSLVPIQPLGSRPPFFCVHGIGGTVLRFRELASHMGEEQPFYGLQARGLDGGDPCPQTVEEMAANYIHEVRRVQPNGPYFLGGYSFGGMVALEMAQQLRAQGDEVAILALLDTFPGRPQSGGELVLKLLRLPLKEKISYSVSRSLRFASYLQRRIKRQLPPDLLAVRRACHQAERRYLPQLYSGKVTLFRPSVKSLRSVDDGFAGWGEFSAGVEIQEIRGRHDDMFFEPNVAVLATRLNGCLQNALTEHNAQAEPAIPGS
jgi:amino acid adenylation domain-containing protein